MITVNITPLVNTEIAERTVVITALAMPVGHVDGGGEATAEYRKTLSSGLTALVLQSEHELSLVKGATVLNPSRAVVDVYTELRSDGSVYVESLLNLLNHTLIIF